MTYFLPSSELNRLHGRAYRAQQRGHFEVCGVAMIDSLYKISLWFLKNKISLPRAYALDIAERSAIARHARLSGLRPLASFHSHPVGYAKPSGTDILGAFYFGRELIYDVCGREAKLWGRRRSSDAILVRELPLVVVRGIS